MRLFFFIALGLLLIQPLALAEESASSGAAGSLSGFLPDACHFSADFSQSRQLQQLPVPLKSGGQLFFDCDLGLIWQTSKPVEEVLIYSRYRHYFLVDKYKNVESLKGVQHFYISRFLLGLLGGDAEFFTRSFSVSGSEENKITLLPKSERLKKGIKKITMERKEKQYEFSLVDASDTQTFISVSSIMVYDGLEKKQQRNICQALMGEYELTCTILAYPDRYESES